MEWLKAILEKAKIEDGKLDIDGVMSTVNSEFPKYAASKGGVLAYTKNVAMRIAPYQAT